MSCDKCQGCKNKFEANNGGCCGDSIPNIPQVDTLFLGLTEACNARCRYCFVHQHPLKMDYELAYEGMKWLARNTFNNGGNGNKLNPNKSININYFGGEPLLRWHDVIVPLTLAGKHMFGNRIHFGMTSNCLLMDEEKLEFMKRYDIGLLFSFDGCKECQDYNRPTPSGKSSFDVVAPKIQKLLDFNPNLTMRMTLHKPTVKYFYENHKFAVDMGFKNTFVAINAFDKWTDEDFKILEEQMYKVADLYIENYQCGIPVRFDPMIRTLEKIKQVESENGTRMLNSNRFGHGKCGIGANGSVILATNGKFYTCQETYTNYEMRDFFEVGNLKDGIDLEKRKQIVGTFNPELLTRNDGVSCDDCRLNKVCDGGCLVRNYQLNGSFNVMPSCVCKYDNLCYDMCLYIRERLKDNELFLKTVRPFNN